MLSSQFQVQLTSGEVVPVSWCDCAQCGNMFMVPTVPENEPRYCCYCGIKFLRCTTAEGETKHYSPDTE
jgi:uncharacterized paraquat-inducible protein A